MHTAGRMRCSICVRQAVDRYYANTGRAIALARSKKRWDTIPAVREANKALKRLQYARNPEKFKLKVIIDRERYRDSYRRYKARVDNRIHSNMSRAIRASLKLAKNGRGWEQIVGYKTEELMKHLEAQFKPGMSWENYGQWEIDHVRPKSTFTFASSSDQSFLECWRMSNLQPLWMSDNRRKHAQWGGVV